MAAWALGDLWSARMPRKFAFKQQVKIVVLVSFHICAYLVTDGYCHLSLRHLQWFAGPDTGTTSIQDSI